MNESNGMYHELLTEAAKQVQANPSADQVIVVKAASGNTYSLTNPVLSGADAENGFVQMLSDRGDAEIKCLVCMWNSGELDVPSMNFRKKLLSACPKNADTLLLLQTDREPTARRLADCISSGG